MLVGVHGMVYITKQPGNRGSSTTVCRTFLPVLNALPELLQNSLPQGFLAVEMMKETALGHPGGYAHVIHGHCGKPAFKDQTAGYCYQLVA